MRAGILALAAVVATGVQAGEHHAHANAHRRHAHKAAHMERDVNDSGADPTCQIGCTTIYEVITGAMTLHNPTSTPVPVVTSSVMVVPIPVVSTASTPGVYTIPATTITVTTDTEVCAPTTTVLPSGGSYTVGGVTTVVETETTVVCPYATTGVSSGVVTTTLLTTTYVCPSAGTYTIAPLTTTCSESTVWVYPTPASIPAGTYTRTEVVTTITETDYVYICPFTSPAPAATSPANVVAPVVSSAVAEASSGVSTVRGQLGNSGEQYGMTYTPYNSQTGDCLSAGQVMSDITSIAKAGFEVVRVYSTDCSALPNIGAAVAANGMKMIIGVYISDTGVAGAQEQVTAIISWAQWSLVELCVIGNEAILSGFTSASELASFISSSTGALRAAGYTGPVTTAEPLSTWQSSHEELCPVVDLVGAQLHAFFNPDTTADQAGPFVKSQLAIASDLCSGKYALCMESGWPSGGSANGAAVPGAAEQAAAIASVKQAVGGHVVIFSFANDKWKAPGAFDCEQTWGAFHLY